MMNFSRNSLPTTPAAATPGSQANTPFGNAVLLDGNMITPLIALPQKQQLPAAAISNSVVDFQRAFQNVMPTTPTQNNNVGQSAEELFRWWISQQAASGALVVGTSTNTPVAQNQTPTTVAAISPMVSNTNVVTVGMSPRANGISPRTNMPAMQSPILHSPVAMNQGQGISPRSISAMSPRNSMSNMNSPSVTNMHSPLSAMNMMAMASGSNQLKSLQAQQQQQQQVQQKPSQSPVKQMPNLSIGGLTPFVNAFNKFYDIFNCDLVDPIGNIVRKDEFPKTCLKEIFTDSKISEALMRRGYQLTPEDYQTLDYVLKINCFDECFAIFLRIYFKNINEVLINIDGEQRVIQYYKNIWKSYLMGSVVLETMYGGGNQEAANMGTLMDQKSLHGGNLAGKVLLALKKWKEFFFNEKEDPYVCIPLAVRKLIEREFSGDGNHTELISPEILNSYKILGIYPTKSTRLSDHPSPLEWFEFVRWHLIKFPVLPEPSNLTPKKPESMNMMVQPPPQMLRPSELSRSSEHSRHEISFHENQSAVDPDEYVEVVATPRPSPKPYTRKLERMRPPFMAPMNFINAANRSNSQPLFVQPQLPSQQNGTLNQHNTTNNNTPITPVNTTISLPMISSYLMQHNGTGMPLLPFRMPTLPHRTQSQHALLPSNNSMNQNGSIMSQNMEQNEGYNSCDDVSIINDKKAIRRIKNNEASRRYRARMREKRKEWAEKLRERDDSISKSPENPTITRDSTCQTSDMLVKNESSMENKLSEFSISLFNRESRESSLESFEPEIAERIVKKQLYKISRREKNNIAVRKYRHKRKQRIEMNKKELVYLSNRHIELLKSIEMLKKQMSVLLAFEGITDNELLRAQVGKLENASAIAKNRFIDPQNLLETPSFLMYSEPDTIIIEESD